MPYCQTKLSTGFCNRQGCKDRHDVRHCSKCDIYLVLSAWDAHIKGKSHLRALKQRSAAKVPSARRKTRPTTSGPASTETLQPHAAGLRHPQSSIRPDIPTQCATQAACHYFGSEERPVRCDVCGNRFLNMTAYEAHKRDKEVARVLSSEQLNGEGGSLDHGTQRTDYIHCDVCNEDLPERSMAQHENGSQHQRRKWAVEVKDAITYIEDDKHGIVVSGKGDDVDFGIVECNPSLTRSMSLKVEKTDKDTRLTIKAIRISSQLPNDGSEESFEAVTVGRSQWVKYGSPTTVEVRFKPLFEGYHRAMMELVFHDTRAKQMFTIVRHLRALVGSQEDHERLKPSEPYTGPPPVMDPPKPEDIHPGRRPVVWSKTKWGVRLPEFPIPKELVEVAFGPGSGKFSEVKRKIMNEFMPKGFNSRTYGQFFEVSLFVEEEQIRRNLAMYAQQGVSLIPAHPYYKLDVPGLAEKRPSVIVGDTLLFQRHDSPDLKWHEAVVHRIEMTQVILRFPSGFSTYKGNKFNIQFVLNRMSFRRQHHAVTSKFPMSRIIFPSEVYVAKNNPNSFSSPSEMAFFNRAIGENERQREVVARIVCQPPGSGPFVVFGPPGTGKTVTVVEAMRQILDNDSNARILACAPTNLAADNLALHLKGIGASMLFRLCALWRDPNSLLSGLEDFVLVNDENVFAVPSLEQLEKFRVIVSTNVSGAILHGIGLPRGHFNHIFVDEAGQAHEPDIMIPIKSMADKYTNIVLSGDPQQLRPVLQSSLASSLGLGQSYIERLMAMVKKQNGEGGNNKGNPHWQEASAVTMVKLVEHYRSHPDIIDFSNQEFYNGELIPRADPVIANSLLRFDRLRACDTQFPIIFHAIAGKDEREGRSPSFFNAAEASLVKDYVDALLDDRRLRLDHNHIGVITPYHGQCGKIGQLLRKNEKSRKIKIGSVEEFQGQERRIIIMSTVRSTAKFVEFDLRHSLGFVADHRRFNVAITRAQALLVIVGDPVILSLDPMWRKFLNYIFLRGGWRGKKIDWDPNEVVSGSLDEKRRKDGQNAAEDLMERTKLRVLDYIETQEAEEMLDGAEAYLDRPWREDN